jgi:NADPH:quinone reductase-like Zn-dependent oxidoreductase
MPVSLPIVPLSDAVGEVVELGPGASRFAVGECVNPVFFPDWIDGPFRAEYFQRQRGSSAGGVLQEAIVIPETQLVRAPRHLGPEAAALPIAALTAWNALRASELLPGQTVLILGTGGVSLFALQFARMFGVQAIVVSTNESKLRRAQELGAAAVIDSTALPTWGEHVLQLTDGRGADLIVEVGGSNTLPQSSLALSMGGHIAMVGYLSGSQITLDVRSLFIGKRARLQGHTVGSRASFEEMNRAIEIHRLTPVIDCTFAWEDGIASAYQRLRSREVFGKILLTL